MRPRLSRYADDAARLAAILLMIATLVFLVFPLILAVTMSFDARDYLGPFPPRAFSLRWYARFFSDSYFLTGLKFSLVLAVLSTLISSAIGVAAAVAIDGGARGLRALATSLFLAPLIVPGVVVGFALLLFYSRIGLESSFLRLLGGHVLISFPYVLRTTLVALGGIPKPLREAALSLGANERRAFWTITLPLAKTGIAAGAVFAFAFSLDDVAMTLFLTDPYNYTLPVALISMMYSNFDLTIAAAAVLLVGSTLVLMVGLDRLIGLDRVVGAGVYRA
ncbi:MAG: ABC transporter permease [Alphaproteobacteria bacterium]